MRPQQDRLRTRNAGVVEPCQVPHLLLGPCPDHLSRVLAAIALPEAELAGDVLVPVLKNENGGFVDLDGTVFALLGGAVIHVGLLAGGDAAVDLGDETAVEQLEENHSGPRVHDLLNGGPIRFVFHAVPAIYKIMIVKKITSHVLLAGSFSLKQRPLEHHVICSFKLKNTNVKTKE